MEENEKQIIALHITTEDGQLIDELTAINEYNTKMQEISAKIYKERTLKIETYNIVSFELIMELHRWTNETLPETIAIIAFTNYNDPDFYYFTERDNVLIMEIDVTTPSIFRQKGTFAYDEELDEYIKYLETRDNRILDELNERFVNNIMDKRIQSMTFLQAERLITFIAKNIDNDFYIYNGCQSATASVIEFMMKSFPKHKFQTNDPLERTSSHADNLLRVLWTYLTSNNTTVFINREQISENTEKLITVDGRKIYQTTAREKRPMIKLVKDEKGKVIKRLRLDENNNEILEETTKPTKRKRRNKDAEQ